MNRNFSFPSSQTRLWKLLKDVKHMRLETALGINFTSSCVNPLVKLTVQGEKPFTRGPKLFFLWPGAAAQIGAFYIKWRCRLLIHRCCPCPWQRAYSQMIFKVLSNPNYSVSLRCQSHANGVAIKAVKENDLHAIAWFYLPWDAFMLGDLQVLISLHYVWCSFSRSWKERESWLY